MIADDKPTPLSQQAAEPVDKTPSWIVPVKALQDADVRHESRLAKLEEKLETRLASIDGNLAALAGVAKDPDFKRHLIAILGSVALILGLVASALAGRASSPPAPAPAPAITVVVPKEAHS